MWIVWCYLLRRDLIWLSGEHMRCGLSGSCRCSGGTPRLTVLEQYTHGIARSGGGRAEAAKPAYRVPPGTCTTGHEKHQNLEKTWITSSKTRRIFTSRRAIRRRRASAIGRRDPASRTRPRRGVHDATRLPDPRRRGAGEARDPPTRGARRRAHAPPGPHTPARHASHDRRHSVRSTCSHPPTRPPTARPRATRVPVRRRPHPRPHRDTRSPPTYARPHTRPRRSESAAIRPLRRHRPRRGRAARPRRGGRAARAGCASRDRVLTARPLPPAPRPWLRRGPRRVLRRSRAAGGPISVGISETTAHSERYLLLGM